MFYLALAQRGYGTNVSKIHRIIHPPNKKTHYCLNKLFLYTNQLWASKVDSLLSAHSPLLCFCQTPQWPHFPVALSEVLFAGHHPGRCWRPSWAQIGPVQTWSLRCPGREWCPVAWSVICHQMHMEVSENFLTLNIILTFLLQMIFLSIRIVSQTQKS